MRILVTGGYGLIGHNVVKRLKDLRHNTYIVDTKTNYGIIPQSEINYLMAERAEKLGYHLHYNTDIANTDPIDYVVQTTKPEVLIHMASFPRQKVVNANPQWGADVMMRGLINLLEIGRAHV